MKKILLILCTVLLFSCKEETYVKQKIQQTTSLREDGYVALYTEVYYKGELVKVWIDDVCCITKGGIEYRKKQADSVINTLKKLGL
jgi:hypothetical protein